MHTDEDERLTLSKWPFYLGDALLVASALAIAVLGDWNLSDWQVASCVVAVALGAGLFVLPYLVEYYLRVGEDGEDRDARLRVLQRRLEALEASWNEDAGELERIDARATAASRAADVLTAAIDRKLSQLEDKITGQFETNRGFAAQLSETAAALDALQKTTAVSLQTVEKEIAELKARPVEDLAANDVIRRIESRLEKLESLKPAPEDGAGHPVRSARRRREPDVRLLHRAIREQPDSSASAVSRIIGRKNPDSETASCDSESTSSAAGESTKAANDVEAEATPPPELRPKPDLEREAAEASAPGEASADGDGADADLKAKPEVETARAVEPEPEPSSTPPNDLFGDTLDATARPRVRAKKKDTALTVLSLIGIGNKPYVRGGGGGLSWERGVEMDFQEIGKWGWIAPSDMEEPVEVQIFRNDEDPDRNGPYMLEPGQKLEISPDF